MKPVQDNAVSESLWIVVAWCVFAAWMLTACYWLPPTASQAPRLILGMPMWVVLGVFLPWLVAIVFTLWFSLCYMTDDPPSEPEDD